MKKDFLAREGLSKKQSIRSHRLSPITNARHGASRVCVPQMSAALHRVFLRRYASWAPCTADGALHPAFAGKARSLLLAKPPCLSTEWMVHKRCAESSTVGGRRR